MHDKTSEAVVAEQQKIVSQQQMQQSRIIEWLLWYTYLTCYVHISNHWHSPGPASTLLNLDLTMLIMGNFCSAELERVNYFCMQ